MGGTTPPAPTQVTPAPLTGIVAPIAGAAPSYNTVNGSTGYTAVIDTWLGTLNNNNFMFGQVYEVRVTLTAEEGYYFASLNDSASI